MIQRLIRKNRDNNLSSIADEFHSKGYIVLKKVLSLKLISEIKSAFDSSKWLEEKSMIFEENGVTPRSLFNVHNLQPTLIRNLIKGRFADLSKEILKDNVYIYQSHINYKKGQTGGEYWWHSDWTFWHFEDGMSEPEALSLIFFLDDVNASNGAMEIIPGSHHFTYTKSLSRKSDNVNINIRHNRFIYTEKDYSDEGLLMKKNLKQMKHKPLVIEGLPGDLFIMDANLWHYSSANKTTQDRRMLFIILNSFHNQPLHVTRPHYLVERNVKNF